LRHKFLNNEIQNQNLESECLNNNDIKTSEILRDKYLKNIKNNENCKTNFVVDKINNLADTSLIQRQD